MALVLKKEKLNSWLARLAVAQQLVAPSDVNGKVLYRRIESPEQVALDFANTVLSPKEWFFPQTDTILRMRQCDEGGVDLTATVDEAERTVFGIRPCDARALVVLDQVFLSEPIDTYYQARRARTTLIGMACQSASSGCFCTSVGSAPDDSSNVDVLLSRCDAGYVVEIVTDRGKMAMADAELEEMDIELAKPVAPPMVAAAGLQEILWKVFDDDLWSRAADRCLGCRACTYLCPTCYCFNVRDYEQKDGTVNRLRGWDSCQSSGFYRLAGGHNPRPTKTSRLRQRFYHKFLYLPDRFGLVGCVGCGRCVENCPVNVDVRELIGDVYASDVISKAVEQQEMVGVESV